MKVTEKTSPLLCAINKLQSARKCNAHPKMLAMLEKRLHEEGAAFDKRVEVKHQELNNGNNPKR